ncbi:DMT family transporter [Anaerocolumna sp. AGMB13025]|uniref:DMT family transporter n=1 Tax=Anaerocolumna sp. AGMB13025 TaxID=3039116 RepID=UPI00241FEF24|nr:DMT family transporter [Anaerocolumna sp. AGMB13025]WFR58677.1 DMT family transporter [Anaerocolumna sp. AGMB13025]
MKSHVYVLLSVFLWGISQYLIDNLLLVFTPALLILLRFLSAGLLILILLKGQRVFKKPDSSGSKAPAFQFRYLLTGGLGAFGYYILMVYALSFSSITFVSIMGGVLPVLAVLFDRFIVNRRPGKLQIFAGWVSMSGILFFAIEGNFAWSVPSALLVIGANISWLFYGHLKIKWNIGEDSAVLAYEFIGAALLTLLFIPSYKILKPLTVSCILELAAVVILSTILPYLLYLKGSKAISISTASMYLNLLPVTSLLPVLLAGTLTLNRMQSAGVILLILSAVIGKEPSVPSFQSSRNS